MHNHSCIKPGCSNQYQDNDPDAYYCPSCQEAKKALAAQIDASIGSRPKKEHVSDLQAFIQQGHSMKKADGSLATFIKMTL